MIGGSAGAIVVAFGFVLSVVVCGETGESASAESAGGGAEAFGLGAVGAHAVALALDLEDDASVEEAVEHGGGDHRVVEDLAPAGDAAVGGEDDRALEVAALDDLEEGGGAFGLQREVAELVDLCRYLHRSTCADIASMPIASSWPV